MLRQRRSRLINIESALDERLVFAWSESPTIPQTMVCVITCQVSFRCVRSGIVYILEYDFKPLLGQN